MAHSDEINKVVLEVGEEIIDVSTQTVEQTEWQTITTQEEITEIQDVVVGYETLFEWQQVGTGNFITTYKFKGCSLDHPISIDSQNEVKNAGYQGDFQLNSQPDFIFPESFSSNNHEPHYHSFKISDVATIGPGADEFTYVNYDYDELVAYPFINELLNTNSNIYTTNMNMSDICQNTYNGFFSPMGWEFRPSPSAGPLTQSVIDDISGPNALAQKTIWKISCKKEDGTDNWFISPGPKGITSQLPYDVPNSNNSFLNGGNNPPGGWGVMGVTMGANFGLWGADFVPGTEGDNWVNIAAEYDGYVNPWNSYNIDTMNNPLFPFYTEDSFDNGWYPWWGASNFDFPGIASTSVAVAGNFYGIETGQQKYPILDEDGEVYKWIKGDESVQGKTLYLYPTENSPYQGVIIFDVFEGNKGDLYVRGHSVGILGFISMALAAQFNQQMTDIQYLSVDNVNLVEGSLQGDPSNYWTTYAFTEEVSNYWPAGVEQSVQGFFSTYNCYLSGYMHGGRWSYGRYAQNGSNLGSNTLIYESEASTPEGISNTNIQECIGRNHVIGSAIVSQFAEYYYNNVAGAVPIGPPGSQYNEGNTDYDLGNNYFQTVWGTIPYISDVNQNAYQEAQYIAYENDSANTPWKCLPTYQKENVLGFKLLASANHWRGLQTGLRIAGLRADQNKGFKIVVDIESCSNARVMFLTDLTNPLQEELVNNFTSDNMLWQSWQMASMYNEDVDTSGEAPYVMRSVTKPGVHETCCPRLYSPFKNGEEIGQETKKQNRLSWIDIMTTKCTIFQAMLDFDYCWLDTGNDAGSPYPQFQGYYGEDGSKFHKYAASYFEIIKILPVDKTLPCRVVFNSIKVYRASFDYSIQTEEELVWQNVNVGQGEITEEQEVVVGYDTTTTFEEVVVGTTEQVLEVDKINWKTLETLDRKTVPVSLTFSVSDIKDVTKRSAGYSKTFELPASQHNERIIGNLSGPGRNRDGSNVQWRYGRMKVGGVDVFKGFVRIEGYESKDGGRYKCHMVEDPVTWATIIGDAKLCDLDFPIHTKNEQNIRRSLGQYLEWDTFGNPEILYSNYGGQSSGYFGDYFTQMIDFESYGDNFVKPYIYTPINYGPWAESTANSGHILTQSIHPGVWVKYLLDKIFENTGFKLISNFFDEEKEVTGDNSWVGKHSTIRRLFLPYTSGEDYDNSEQLMGADGTCAVEAGRSERQLFCDDSPGGSASVAPGEWQGPIWPELIVSSDPGDNWFGPAQEDEFPDTSCSESCTGGSIYGGGIPSGGLADGNPPDSSSGYVAPFDGFYHVDYYVEIGKFMPCSDDWDINQEDGHIFVGFGIKLFDAQLSWHGLGANDIFAMTPQQANNNYENGNTAMNFNGYPITSGGGVGSIEENGICLRKIYFGTAGSGQSAYNSNDGNYIPVIISMNIYLQQGQRVRPFITGKNDNITDSYMIRYQNQSFHAYPNSMTSTPESDVSLKKALGCGMKQMDLIKGLTEMFNLHWTADSGKKEVYCEPYNDFYGSGKILDWTGKVDMGDWEDKYIIDELAKDISFAYKSDSGDNLIDNFEDDNAPLWSLNISNEQLYNKNAEKKIGTDVFASTMQFKRHPDNRTDMAMGGDITWPGASSSGGGPDMPAMWSGLEDSEGYDAYSDPDPVYSYLTTNQRPEEVSHNFADRVLCYYGRPLTQHLHMLYIEFSGDGPQFLGRTPYSGTVNYYVTDGEDHHSLAWEDINFGPDIKTKGLYTKYWAKMFDKINQKGTLRTCNMLLTANDINQFDYRDIIKLDFGNVPSYWTVNKISDYKPGRNELTKVELVEFNLNTSVGLPTLYRSSEYKPVKKEDAKIKKKRPNIVSTNKQKGFAINNETNNKSIGDGIAIGHNVQSKSGQTVLGRFNKSNATDMLQIGGGYITKAGNVVRRNALVIDQYGELVVNGGNVKAQFTTNTKENGEDVEITSIHDVYYRDEFGNPRKLYLK